MTKLCQPENVFWCSGSEQENKALCDLMVKNGTSDQPAGIRTYEFQVSDNSTFPANTASTKRTISGFALVMAGTGVPEDASGRT